MAVLSAAVSTTAGIGLFAGPVAISSAAPTPSIAPSPIAPVAPLSAGVGTPGGATHAKVVPALTVSPTSGNVSSEVALSATGYAHSSAFTIIYVDASGKNATACAGTTSSTGTFSCSFEIPGLGAGAHLFTGTDAKGNKETADFAVTPELLLTPDTGLGGTPVTVQGTGFGAKVTGPVGTTKVKIVHFVVSASWVDGTICSGVKTSNSGGFNCTLSDPALVPGGKQKFSAVDNASNKATTTFDVLSGLTVGPSSGMDGTNVTFIGTGFAATTTAYVSWSVGRACHAGTLGTGEFSCSYSIPADTPGGSYTFAANDSSGHTAQAPFVVTYVSASPANGPVGTRITISAGGFAADTALTIDWGSTVACPSNSTNAYGAYSCQFVVPPSTAGAHYLTGVDAQGNRAVGTYVVDPALRPSPAYGADGTSVTFNGTGFAADSPVEVTWASGIACGSTTGATGGFNCSYAIPGGTAGTAYTFTATDGEENVGTATFTVTYVSVTPAVVPVGGNLTVAGAGFAPLTPFTVTSGSLSLCSGTSTSLGALSCSRAFTVPYLVAGTYPVLAQDTSPAKNTADATFTVTPSLSVKPKDGVVGTEVTFNGTGYAADSLVTISFPGGTLCTVTTTKLGTLKCGPVPILPAAAGTYALTGTDADGNTAHVPFTIGPSLVASPDSSPVGSPVELSADGFTADAAIAISWSEGTACAGTTTASGAYACSFSVPLAPGGSYTFTAADAESVTATTTLNVTALLTLGPSTGTNGTLVTFQGTGFLAVKAITVSWSIGKACVATSTSAGEFSCSYSIPPAPGGTYSFSATDGTNTATAPFTVVSALTDTPARGPVGTLVTFSGAGFAKSELVKVEWPSDAVACSTESLPTGGFGCSFSVPATTPGPKTFTASDPAGDRATVTFTVVPSVVPSPPSGPVGTLVTFNGSGFSADAAVTVSSPGLAACDATSNVSGSFSCVLTVPLTTFGAHEFTATDKANTATTNFTVLAQLTATPASGLVGTTVTFAGTGYAPVVGVTVSWADGNACSNTTSATGQFSCRYTIPSGTPGGVYPFTGADGAGDTAQATFTVTTSLVASPDHGMDNTTVTFSGTGFAADAPVSVSWPSGPACTATATGAGTFACTFEIPAGTPGGSYTFTAKDGDGHLASTAFLVTYLVDSPPGALAGASVGLTAGGFAADSPFSITFSGTDTTVCSGTTTGSGTYACSTNIPVYLSPGRYSFAGTDGTLRATVAFTVFGSPTVGAPAPSRPAGDVAQSVTFSTTASGGSGSYSLYSWTESLPGLGCSLVNAATIGCEPSAAGNYTVSVQVTDSSGDASAIATSATYRVSPDPQVATPTENVSSSDANQSVTFTASGAGGAGALTYAWNGLPTGCAGTTAVLKCTPTRADPAGSVSVTVTDANGFSVTSGPLAITVYADPAVGAPTASRSGADVGQSVTFTASATGGSGGLTYAWQGLPSGCTSATDKATCSWSSAVALAEINVTVTDSNHFRATSPSLGFKVDADPTVSTPTATRSSIDVGQTVTFAATANGGAGGFTYAWANLPPGCSGTGASVRCTPTGAAGGLSITVTVTDANGFRVTSDVLMFSVYGDPAAAVPLASSRGADIGQTVTFSANLTGGAPPLTFVWHGLPAGCGGTGPEVVCLLLNASEVGEYTISYTATDANDFNATSTGLAFHWDPAPSVTTPTASRPSADVNQSVTFSVEASGGAGDYVYVWVGLPAGCSGSGPVVVCVPSAPLNASAISVNVTDANGDTIGSLPLVYSVYARPIAGTPTASVASADVGQSVDFMTAVTGGSGGLVFTWSGLPSGCAGTGAVVVCASVGGAAPYNVSVTVEDSNGVTNTSAELAFTVYADPSVATPVASAPGADVGQTITFTATATGGAGNLTFAWTGLPAGCTGTTTATVSCALTTAVTDTTIAVTVTDTNGESVTSGGLTYTVDPALGVSVVIAPSSFLAGHSVTFTAKVTGGSGSYAYAWTGLPSGCSGTGPTITCRPTSSGGFTVSVSVEDSNEGTAKASASGTVQSAFLGLPAAEGIGLLAVGAIAGIVLVALLALLLVRRRHRSTSAPVPWTPAPSAPPSAPPAAPAAAPPPWSPAPAETVPSPDEPAPWEMPPADAAGDEPESPSDGA